MKNLLLIFSLVFSLAIFAAHHEKDKQTSLLSSNLHSNFMSKGI